MKRLLTVTAICLALTVSACAKKPRGNSTSKMLENSTPDLQQALLAKDAEIQKLKDQLGASRVQIVPIHGTKPVYKVDITDGSVEVFPRNNLGHRLLDEKKIMLPSETVLVKQELSIEVVPVVVDGKKLAITSTQILLTPSKDLFIPKNGIENDSEDVINPDQLLFFKGGKVHTLTFTGALADLTPDSDSKNYILSSNGEYIFQTNTSYNLDDFDGDDMFNSESFKLAIDGEIILDRAFRKIQTIDMVLYTNGQDGDDNYITEFHVKPEPIVQADKGRDENGKLNPSTYLGPII